MYYPLFPSSSRGEVRRARDASRETYLVGARDAPARTEDRGRGGDPDLQGRRPEGRDRRRRVPERGPREHHRVDVPHLDDAGGPGVRPRVGGLPLPFDDLREEAEVSRPRVRPAGVEGRDLHLRGAPPVEGPPADGPRPPPVVPGPRGPPDRGARGPPGERGRGRRGPRRVGRRQHGPRARGTRQVQDPPARDGDDRRGVRCPPERGPLAELRRHRAPPGGPPPRGLAPPPPELEVALGPLQEQARALETHLKRLKQQAKRAEAPEPG